MAQAFSIFDAPEWLSDEIYVHGLKESIKEMFDHLGGPKKVSEKLVANYDQVREWTIGRKPISIRILKKLILLCDLSIQFGITNKINSTKILLSCKYSPHKVKFPTILSTDLAYVVGLILGDGCLAGDKVNKRGGWYVETLFDNLDHQKLYNKIIQEEFGINVKSYQPKNKNCYCSHLNSKVIHWFLRCYFGMSNGYKASKIVIPKIVLNETNNLIRISILQGLFDSDGTITSKRSVSYSSTSRLIVKQVIGVLAHFEVKAHLNTWLKSKKYLPLYTVRFSSKLSVKKFAEHIGFRHPIKHKKLVLVVSSI